MDTTPEHPAQRAWSLLLELMQAERPRFLRIATETGMTPTDLGVLKLVSEAGGPVPMQDLAQFHDKSSITRAVHRLVEAGLVERFENPTDRRAKLVALTDEGKALRQRALDAIRVPPDAFLELSAADLDHLARVLESVVPSGRREP
ncbi:MAG: MarR family transcriptional regulator [Alphaproteobacteria bacterium]|nr:MarR family transcriptional regulator [Alphaproteobacteria bacterium]MCB9691197.1 MarR family transcriptional regulator [Alphaproteobacteria bacterium]